MTMADRVALDQWHIVGAVEDLPSGQPRATRLLDTALTLLRLDDGTVEAFASERSLAIRLKFGYVWTSLGAPKGEVFDIPEFQEPDRRNMNAASMGVRVSAPRAVENFLDLAHFAFVHTNYLGVEPHTEIKPYRVEITSGDELLATKCIAYQPLASLVATGGYDVEYVYRVPHPYCAILYKANAADLNRNDVICLFLQPVSEEHSIGHMLLSVLDENSSDKAIRQYQQLIFGQDKPILENQIPKKLPLDMRTELSAKADASSGTYRRWLKERGVRYGTI